MAPAAKLYVQIAHQVGGRTRLRLSPPPLEAPLAERLAATLVSVPGMRQVAVNRRTGGILCHHAPGLDAGAILCVLRDAAPATTLEPGQSPPASLPTDGPSSLARAMAGAFRSMNADLLTASQGSLDLGTAAAFGFMSAGAVEVATTGNLPIPPWFNLAWWAFRTFMTFEAGPRPTSAATPAMAATP